MAAALALKVLTPEGLSVADEAVSVIAPGGLGYLGMLRNHAPLVTTLLPGKLAWQRPGGEWCTLYVGEGLLEVAKNQLTLLTGSVSESPPSPRQR